MIVKNEATILERCLASVAPHISCYVIADTGSTDGTQDLIRRFFAARGVPGEVVEFPFVNFEQARNRALDAARASRFEFEYILLTDADMELVVTEPPLADKLVLPAYGVTQYTVAGLEYPNIRLVRRDLACKYEGVTHECLVYDGSKEDVLGGAHFIDHACGSSRTIKTQRDIALLTAGLKEDPGNARYAFYLANSHLENGDYREAIAWYTRRIGMSGFYDEAYVSSERIAVCHEKLGEIPAFFHQCLTTFEKYPNRAEPLFRLGLHCMQNGLHRLGYHFASIGRTVPKPPPLSLFIESSVYSWRLIDVQAVCAFYMGRTQESLELNERLLTIAPADQHDRIRANIAYCRK
jgi:tetratricopeptide (TPR) repeat protein